METMSSSTPESQRTLQSAEKSAFIRVVNVTRKTEIARNAEVAGSAAKRSMGLLSRKGLSAKGCGLFRAKLSTRFS